MAALMEVDEPANQEIEKITSESFLKLRESYLASRNPQTGFAILNQLVRLDANVVDDSAWLDCKDLLTLIFSDIPAENLLGEHQVLLLQALPNAPANVVDALATLISKKPQSAQLLGVTAVAVAVAFARRINHIDTFESIAVLLAPVSSHQLVLQELMHQLDSADGPENSEHRFRVYQVLLESFRAGSYTDALLPVLHKAVAELTAEPRDVLSQLSVLDFLADCAIANEPSAKVINSIGVPQKVHEIMESSREAPDGGFLYPACVRFFGHLSRRYPEAITTFPAFVNSVVDLLRHFDLLDASQRVLAFDTFANVAYSAEAKNIIANAIGEDSLNAVLRSFGAAINSGPVDLRERHVQAAALLFEEGNDAICSSWLSLFGEPFPNLVLAGVQKPFPEFRAAFLRFLATVFQYPTIIINFIRLAGFTEWLLDEKTETDYELSILKKAVVRAILCASEDNKDLIDAPLIVKLKAYLLPTAAQPTVELAL